MSSKFTTYKRAETGQGQTNGWGGSGIHVFFLKRGTANKDNIIPVKYKTTINVLCYNCKKLGHLFFNLTETDHCHNGGKSGNRFLQIQYGFTINE